MDTRSAYIHRSRKGSRRDRRLAAMGALGVVVCASLFAYELQGGMSAGTPRQATTAATAPAPVVLRTAAPAQAEAPVRRVYRYSIVPGGVHDSQELARVIAADAVVAAHYADFDPARFTVRTVDKPRAVYVSYRKGGKVYWTAKKLQLVKGETLLSDGINEIRTRCGNRISDVPMLPVETRGPSAAELDTFVDRADSDDGGGMEQVNAESEENPAGAGFPLQTFANGGVVAPAGGTQQRTGTTPVWNGPDSVGRGGAGGPPLLLTNSVEQNVPATDTGGDKSPPGKTETPADTPGSKPDTLPPSPRPDTPDQPGTDPGPTPPSTRPGTPDQPGTDPGTTPPSIPGPLTPPTNEPGKPTVPGRTPTRPTDVPEPGTPWLGAAGVVALLAARRGKKRD